MTLNKRYIRNIKDNLSFYIASIVLTAVALLMFFLFYIAGTGIKDYGDKFFDKNKLEDATFTTYLEIPDKEIEKLEDKYNITFEKEHYVNISEDDYKVRVFKANHKIDLYEVTDGKDVENDDEIVISKGYAENMNVKLGDSIEIAGKSYKVTGFFLRPDYLNMLENADDTYKNITSFFLAYMTDVAYDALGSNACQYKVIYNKNSDSTAFRKYINDEYKVNSYLSKDDNERITMVDDQAVMFIVMAYVFLVTLPLITVALISIIIGRKVKNEQKMIGTLTALGYKKSQLVRHYAILAMIPGVAGGILVTIITKILQQPYGELGLADYEPMPVKFRLPIFAAILGIVIPTLLYALAAIKKVNKLLKKDTVTLLNGNADELKKTKRVMVNSKSKVKNKFAVRSLLGNPGRTFVVFLGAALGAFIITIGFTFIDTFNNIVDNGMGNIGTFKYEYILNSLETKEYDDAEELIVGNYEYKDATFSLMGADSDVSLMNTNTKDGKKVDLDKGFYISNVMAYAYKIKAGDTVKFKNPYTMEEYSVVIEGIIDNDSQKLILGRNDKVREIMGIEDEVYNCLLSKEKLDIGDKVSKTITSDDIKEQMQTVMDEMGSIIYALIIIGAIICVSALYVSVNMLLTENRHNISMLKVLGLTDKEINRMVINVNHLIIPFSIAVGMGLGYLSMIIVFRVFSQIEGNYYKSTFSFTSFILTIAIVTLCYIVSLILVRRKVNKVNMVESLKDNRE